MELSKLITDIKKEGKLSNDEIVKHLVESIEEGCDAPCISKDLYHKAYGSHLNESICKDWVMHMDITDGSDRETGEKWTINQTTELAQSMNVPWDKITKYEWYACVNAWYSDFFKTGKMFQIEGYKGIAEQGLQHCEHSRFVQQV